MLFDELPRVPNINLEPKEVSELPISQVRPVQQETKNQPQYSDEDLNINGNTTEVQTSKYSTFDQETSLALQQQQFEKEELRKQFLQELKDKEYADKLQQQFKDEELEKQNINVNGNTAEVHTSKYSTFDQATSLALQQQQFEEEELRKKLQQELKDKEYAEKLQQLFEDEELEKQNAQQNEPISTEILTTSPSLPEPQLLPPPSPQPSQPRQQPPPTQEEIFENLIAQLDNEKEQYDNHIWNLRHEHRLEQSRYNEYKFDWTISHNKEIERSWRQHLLTYEQEEDTYEEFMKQYRHKREDLLDQYDNYLRATGRKKDECCIQ